MAKGCFALAPLLTFHSEEDELVPHHGPLNLPEYQDEGPAIRGHEPASRGDRPAPPLQGP
jgi:hypothetical protein